jgi:hypothetical protein
MLDPPVTDADDQPPLLTWPTCLTCCARGMNPSCPSRIANVWLRSGQPIGVPAAALVSSVGRLEASAAVIRAALTGQAARH